MSNRSTQPDRRSATALLSHFALAARKVFENAVDLHDEALLLGSARRFSRALVLHQISLEECAKVDILGAAATGALMGETVNTKRLYSALARHRAKNATNAYMLPVDSDERRARDEGRWEDAHKQFETRKAKFHEDSNKAKNDGLYVEITDRAVLTPNNRISEDMVSAIRLRNQEYLARVDLESRMLTRWAADPTAVTAVLAEAGAITERARAASDPMKAMEMMMEEFRTAAGDSGYLDRMRRAEAKECD